MEITSDRRRDLDPAANSAASTTTYGAPSSPPRTTPTDARVMETFERLPPSPEYGVYLAQLHRPEIEKRLDAFRDRFSGPYTVDGQTVMARPMFRMNVPNAFNADLLKANRPHLVAACQKGGTIAYAHLAISGRCSPEQLVKVTQSLIDANRLPPADAKHTTLESRIRLMQWQHGIGVDCAGYTQQAAAEAHGAAGHVFKANLMGDIFTNMGKDPRFQSIEPIDMRPGDVIHLEPEPKAKARGEVGHNVIVRSASTLDSAAKNELRSNHASTIGTFLDGAGPYHVFEVDSSWGAGKEGNDYGGFRRDTWIYDASTDHWACYTAAEPRALYCDPDTHGPQGEVFAGAYRPKTQGAR